MLFFMISEIVIKKSGNSIFIELPVLEHTPLGGQSWTGLRYAPIRLRRWDDEQAGRPAGASYGFGVHIQKNSPDNFYPTT